MGLISKTIMVKWGSRNKKWYVDKGYTYTKKGEEFEVKAVDLPNGSQVLVEVQCDCKDCTTPIINPVIWQNYLKYVKEDGKYYCRKCSVNLFGKHKMVGTRLKNGKSFQQWCLENNRQDILDRWDYELNDCLPSEISYGVKKGFWFKCPKKIHNSELKNIKGFTSGQDGSMDCKACNSFAQYIMDNYGEDMFKQSELDNANINLWKIPKHSSTTNVYMRCNNINYHGKYKVKCDRFIIQVNSCPYCGNHKVHPLDSLGTLHPEVLEIWSDKNKKSPYEYSPKSQAKVWWKCSEGIHNDYLRSVKNSNIYEFRCPECQFSKGEKRIEEYLKLKNFIKDKDYIPQKKFNGLLGLGNGQLSYDFYLLYPYNLLIEYQGEFHDGTAYPQTEEELKYQQEHDRRKREYARNNNINLLEIWYWDYDNIEEILDNYLKISSS